ncbi:putative flavoprotein [Thermobacillus composti KWC4]|uniref:Putative flavoprotein n=1 Tax=Thermobacillus composti (strain DSM 18247 / JCM 13945 / KWC4) TaxID=717605 RepID=L0EH03_THECK|nr:NADPH-dependent FMN reductase [Thermobacillus composti]AGA58966.1 putative flavoprotein [Thermobacillus composti KWC4]
MRVVAIAGSNRSGSTSTRLAKYIVAELRRQGVQADLYDLHQDPLPFYSPDEAHDDHAGLLRLKRMAAEADGIVLASPEYHGSISGVLKNALDHLGKEQFGGKPVLSATSSGGPVGISSLLQLQAMVRNLHGINCPEWISIGGEQRKLFEAEPEAYMPEHAALDRIHGTLRCFLDLLRSVRGQGGV